MLSLLSFILPILAWDVPFISPVFLKRLLLFHILLFSSISLHWSHKKAFFSLLAVGHIFPFLLCLSFLFLSYLSRLLRQHTSGSPSRGLGSVSSQCDLTLATWSPGKSLKYGFNSLFFSWRRYIAVFSNHLLNEIHLNQFEIPPFLNIKCLHEFGSIWEFPFSSTDSWNLLDTST